MKSSEFTNGFVIFEYTFVLDISIRKMLNPFPLLIPVLIYLVNIVFLAGNTGKD
jgi:hypothetical protein